jgi:hypothetical protein
MVLPDPELPSPNVQLNETICAFEPGRLVEASNTTGEFAFTVVGDSENAAVGVPAGGRMTPGGTSRTSVDCETAAWKFDPTGVTRIVTTVPAPAVAGGGAAGAVKVADARPSTPVTIVREDRVPKSWRTPPTSMSRWSDTPEIGLLSGPRTVARIVDRDTPSCVMLSGVAETTTDWANSDGPERLGTSVW